MQNVINTTANPILSAALDYAANGVPVFPCRARDEIEKHWKTGEAVERFAKSPYPSNGLYAASTFPHIINRFWTDHRGALIGMPTGKRTGVLVLDIDPRHGGDETLAALEAKHGALPETRLARLVVDITTSTFWTAFGIMPTVLGAALISEERAVSLSCRAVSWLTAPFTNGSQTFRL